MKTTLLIIALACSSFTAAYSQINQRHKKDPASTDLPIFKFKHTPDYTLVKPNDQEIRVPALADDRLARREQHETIQEQRMPCYKPAGVFSMRIVKPDSTVNHTMPVKKF